MSTNLPPGSGQQPPLGYGQQPAWTGPPTNAPSGGGAVTIVIAVLGVVVLLGLACAGAATGFLFFARSTIQEQVERERMEIGAQQANLEKMAAALHANPPTTELFKSTDPKRAMWIFERSPEGTGGQIVHVDAMSWVETRGDRVTYQFQELSRSDEYVELFDTSRQLYVRLFSDHIEWRRDGQEWSRGQDGVWQTLPTSDASSQP